MYADGDVQLQELDRRKFDQYNYISEDEEDDYEATSDEPAADQRKDSQVKTVEAPPKGTKIWNDIPEDFLDPAPKGKKVVSQEQRPESKRPGEWDEWAS